MTDGVVTFPPKRARKAPPARPGWHRELLVDGKGRPLPNLANAMTALRAAPELGEVFAYDEMLKATLLMAALPDVEGFVGDGTDSLPRPARDTDVSQLQEWVQRNGIDKIGRETCHQAVDLRARERAFHPIRDWLDGLRWDGTPRLDRWLSYYLGAQQTPYSSGIGPMVLTAMVARIYKPGAKVDYAMVLEGEQGSRKSSACAILGGPWFSDNLPDVTSGKDVSQHIRGKWLVEIAELSATSKAEAEALKAFITRETERYRPSYGRVEVIEPRECIFIGTTNRSAYLRDETGGRRFWPVRVGRIDTAALEHDRSQLFAEAVHCYRAGATWWPDEAFERDHVRVEQEARFDIDAWEVSIRSFLEGRTSVLVGEIAREGLLLETPRLGRAEQNRITAILERLEWRRQPKDWRGNVRWAPTR